MFSDKPVIIHRVSRVTSFVLIITSLNALAAGYSFIVDPDGSGLGITLDYLQHSPFRSFLIPGIVLMTCIGIVSIIAAAALFCKKNYASGLVITEAFLLGGWIIIQSIMLREINMLHGVFFLIAVFLLCAGIFLRTRPAK